ncbi:meprin A subunit alpha [Biomphalaria glabrata]|nr:meprin A subunit alpha [Biomphalaria glabrata]
MAVNVFTYTSGLVLLALLVVSVTCRPTLEDTHQGVGISSPEKANVAQARSDSVQPKVPDRPVFILGDVEIPLHRNAIRNKSMHWKDGIVPFVVDNDYPDTARATILAGLHEIEADVESQGTKCIQFIPRTTEQNYLRIKRGTGCHSPIGFDPGEDGAVVSTLGPGCEIKGIVMHEILHVLGFYHEQNRPDRDLYVDINETNVAVIRDFYIRNETIIDTMGIPYDFLSIMHYGAYNSAQVKRYPVITPKPKYGRTLRLGQRVGLSPTDVIKVQTLYNCPLDTSHIHSDMDERVIERCDFALGMCNFTTDNTAANYAAKWVVQTEPTSDGPVAGYTNGLDAFLFASLKDEEAFSSIASKEVSSQATVQPTENLTTLKNEINLKQATTTRTPQTTTVYSPLLTSGEDGMVCVQYVIYQKGPSSFLQLFLSGPLLQRQELRNYKPLSHDYWARDEVRIDLGRQAEFRLEFVANLQEGSVAIDDYYVVKGECIYSS